jgi:hypothetical protein
MVTRDTEPASRRVDRHAGDRAYQHPLQELGARLSLLNGWFSQPAPFYIG